MTEESGKLVSEKTRPALVNLTNLLPAKRGLSSILGDLLHKSECESGKSVAYECSREKFSKRLCLVVDDLVKESAKPIDSDTIQGSSLSDDKNSSGGGSDDKVSEESHDAMVEMSSGVGDGKALKESSNYKKSSQIYFEPGDKDGARVLNVVAINEDATGDKDGARELNEDVTGEGLALSVISGITESQKPPVIGDELRNCQNLRSFEMSRCSNINNKEHVNQNMGDDDLLKSCSCSFCLKAAYIWCDLHYQDTKGRLSALKKSQKLASNLIERNGKERSTDLHASVNSVSYSKQESDLMGQWRSLFLSMGDILAHESNHLQNTFVAKKKMRDDCKMDLERAMITPQHNTE
uniref:Uncharacterized protein n=1 Tax=Cardamine hirsuta TaxID=50463 RepID=A0A0K0KGQ7_CARHR|nr:hypothetical protein [Cardamine hirsuta]